MTLRFLTVRRKRGCAWGMVISAAATFGGQIPMTVMRGECSDSIASTFALSLAKVPTDHAPLRAFPGCSIDHRHIKVYTAVKDGNSSTTSFPKHSCLTLASLLASHPPERNLSHPPPATHTRIHRRNPLPATATAPLPPAPTPSSVCSVH